MKEYNPYRLLMLGEGRCSQDDCAVKPVSESGLPEWVRLRRSRKLESASILDDYSVLLWFRDGTLRKADLEEYLMKDPGLELLQRKPERFQTMKMYPGGLGLYWSEETFISAEKLYGAGKKLPLTGKEFMKAIKSVILDTADVCSELECSRQYVGMLVKKNELPVIKESGNNRLYTRNDVERLKEY